RVVIPREKGIKKMDYEAMELFAGRRSIRQYRNEIVPHQLLLDLLKAATWAPSAHNRQPWRFAVIDQPRTKERLAKAMGKKLRADRTADGVPEEIIESDVDRSFQRITGAPVVILVALTVEGMDSYPDQRRQNNEWLMAVQSAAMAGQNLMLAAHANGLGSCWMCGPLFSPDVVRKTLNLPADWQPQGLIVLGYAAEEPQKGRRPLAEVVRFVT
ncbi:MAG: nitroreductase family protein, partial [Candidatus Promineifilaceae bacterium]